MACFKALGLALGLRFAAGAAAHPTGRRFEQKWSGSYRLGAGYRTRAPAGLARIIFLLAHETTEPSRQPSRYGVIVYETAAASGKRKGTRRRPGPPPQSRIATYPLVTTGGGALPLPTWAQPVMLRSASTAAIATVSFFMGSPPLVMTLSA